MFWLPEEDDAPAFWLPEEDDVPVFWLWAGAAAEDDALPVPEAVEEVSGDADGCAVDALPKGCAGSAGSVVPAGAGSVPVFGCAADGAAGAAPCTGWEKGVSRFPAHAVNNKTAQFISAQSTAICFFKRMHFPSLS